MRTAQTTRRKIFRLLRLQHRRLRHQLRPVTLGGSPPRTHANYQQRSGARHRLAPAISSTSALASNATIPTALGGSTTTLPPIVVVILRQQLAYLYIIDYTAPTTPHPIKAKFSSSKSGLLFPFATPDTRGLRHEKSSCISLTSKNCESPSSWRSLSNT
jgi:hypothetical protein